MQFAKFIKKMCDLKDPRFEYMGLKHSRNKDIEFKIASLEMKISLNKKEACFVYRKRNSHYRKLSLKEIQECNKTLSGIFKFVSDCNRTINDAQCFFGYLDDKSTGDERKQRIERIIANSSIGEFTFPGVYVVETDLSYVTMDVHFRTLSEYFRRFRFR